MIAEVLINEKVNKLDKTFDYKVPKELEENIKIGSVVKVTLRGKKITGFVLNIKDKSNFKNLVNIIEIINNEDLTNEKIKLAKIISIKTFSPLAPCIKLFLNPGISKKTSIKTQKEKIYSLEENIKKIVNIESFEETKTKLKEKENIKITENHFNILKYFIKENIDAIYKEILMENLDINSGIIKTCVKNKLLKEEEIEVTQNIYNYSNEKEKKLELNKEQKQVFNKIIDSVGENKFKEFLLFGVTGSGKTEVYMQSIEETIKKGKNAIMLVPEIGLTPQMEKVFSKRFGSKISIMHSRLSKRERFDEWENIRKGEKNIVIGTRSAIFSPLKNIGIIIIDEQHDKSYIAGSTPRYDAKEVARLIAKLNNAVYISGSATPLVNTMYEAKKGKINLLEMKNRVASLKLPEVEVVNMRTKKGIFSDKLVENINKNIDLGKQSLIFLNRRGFSNLAICRSCGKTYTCPNCSVNLTYHKRGNIFKCHYCGYSKINTGKCENCGENISFIGVGTQKVKEELEKTFKKLKEEGKAKREITSIIMDQDSVNLYGSHKDIINEFLDKKRDVLIGTQMIAKGHDFADVNLVSVLFADNILNSKNYDGSEIAFETLVQVIGRAGRKENGKAIIETYNPEHYLIELARENNYDDFYKQEIKIRKNLNYPPFTDILTFQILSKKEQDAVNIGTELFVKLKKYINILKNNLYKKYEKVINEKLINIKNKEEKERIKQKYMKEYIKVLNKIEIYDLQPYRINKIDNIYRWKIVMKCRYNVLVMMWIKDILKSINLPSSTNIYLLINDSN